MILILHYLCIIMFSKKGFLIGFVRKKNSFRSKKSNLIKQNGFTYDFFYHEALTNFHLKIKKCKS